MSGRTSISTWTIARDSVRHYHAQPRLEKRIVAVAREPIPDEQHETGAFSGPWREQCVIGWAPRMACLQDDVRRGAFWSTPLCLELLSKGEGRESKLRGACMYVVTITQQLSSLRCVDDGMGRRGEMVQRRGPPLAVLIDHVRLKGSDRIEARRNLIKSSTHDGPTARMRIRQGFFNCALVAKVVNVGCQA